MSEQPRSRSEELHELLSDLGRCVQEAVTALPRSRPRSIGFVNADTSRPSSSRRASPPGSSPSPEGEAGIEMSVGVHRGPDPVEAAMTPLDKKFLRSLKISVE